jgi:hypothetical protein
MKQVRGEQLPGDGRTARREERGEAWGEPKKAPAKGTPVEDSAGLTGLDSGAVPGLKN